MRQQINLYQPTLRGERKLFSAGPVAIAFGLVMAGLAAFSVRANLQVSKLERDVAVLRAEQVEQEAKTAQFGEAQAARAKPVEIESRIKRLSRSVTERGLALQMLQSGAAGQTTGFASRLEALARRRVDGLWIDALMLSGTNGSMSLSGATLNPDIVPRYLQNLARDSVLTGTRFDDFVIERPEQAKGATTATDETGAAKKPAQKYIRFRAGTRALTASAPETAT
jgi:hypothetical protein